ncbi:uncharacterized protein LOC132308205 [Cornus florida]|uniref:uncharacterized protein LOC132308205 n=1 Tax=Cornus florida TaxID=4283 RepID=UPI0028A03205|nr:uncharacterized protein LOC132308205 [Cornus florida]
MTRSSRHKSHKQSKHGSKDEKEYSESAEDVKMNERNGKEEGSVRLSRDSYSGEKRKVSSQSREGKDPSDHGNGDTTEEPVVSKRRKEKADAAATDRWNSAGDERGDGVTTDKERKGESSRLDSDKSSKSKVSADSKSKTSRRHDNVSEKKEENVCSVPEKVDPKHKSEKDSGLKAVQQYKDSKESKDKERGLEKEKKVQNVKRDAEAPAMDGEVAAKQGSQSGDFGEERQGKRSRENTGRPIQDELRNPELEKELEKRIRKRRDGSSDKDRNQDHAKEIDDKRLSSRGERGKDGRYKDEKHKDGSHGDKYKEDGGRENRNKDNKYGEDGDKDNRVRDEKYREDGARDKRHRDDKHREDGDRDTRNRDGKYQEEGERDNRHRDDKYRDDGDRENRHRDDKYREDGERENRHRDEKYREDGERDYRHRDEKYREDGERDNRHRDDKYRDDGERDNRHRDDKYREDGERDNRQRDDKYRKDADRDNKHREDFDRENKHSDGKIRDDFDRDKRLRDLKYRDERISRDRTSDKSDIKRSRDESNAGERYRKSTNRDDSPIYDDRSNRYKDDKGKRRANDKDDKEDNSDMRYHSTKEQRSDAERKSMSSAKVDLVTDRGRYSRNADVENSLSHSRRRSSPSSSYHAARDHYRLSKQEGSKYRDYANEERVWHDVTAIKEFSGVTQKVSASRSIEKSVPKDESHLSEFSIEKRQKTDSRTSPLQKMDKSPSSSSTDRRHLTKSDIRRSLDIEESGQRSGGSRDTKDYSDKEGRGSRELPMDTLPVDELSQADGDTLSVSSPFSRTSRFPSNSKSLLPPPPPPFRTGVDNHLAFSMEDDNRGKSINRHRRVGDSSIGRAQGNTWKGVQNWPSPMANGFLPFPHGPPPVGFHPVMQQFPAPQMFGVRPSMEINHTGVPYHIPDADRFSGHGRTFWRNPVDDSCPPPLHGWDANNSVFGEESHLFGRPDWDHNRFPMSGRGWETGGEMWKGQNSGVSTELPADPQKQDYSAHGPADEVWIGQSGERAQNEQKQPCLEAENIDINKSSGAVATNTLKAPKTLQEDKPSSSKPSRKDDDFLWHAYLSKLDISADLTQPELYKQCTSLVDMHQKTNSGENDSKIPYTEEAMEAKVMNFRTTLNASPFAAINDSIFQKAMSLYKKQREEIKAINGERVPFLYVVPKDGSNDDEPGELDPACDQQEADDAVSEPNQEKAELPNTSEKLEVSPVTTKKAEDEPDDLNSLKKSEEPFSTSNEVETVVDPVCIQEASEKILEDKSSPLENVECDVHSPCKVDDVDCGSDSIGNHCANNSEEQKLVDTMCGAFLFSGMSSEACEVVMPESIESGLVNLSRIHHSPESTH